MNTGLFARASVTIAAPPADVWEALVTPAAIKTYMFGATVTSDWVVGSPIVWTGEWQSRAYKDKGIVLEIVESECSSSATSARLLEWPICRRTTTS